MPLVLRLRPGDEPVVSGVAAVCLDLAGGDALGRVAAALASLTSRGLAVRCRPPEVLFDEDQAWWAQVAALPWAAVYARHAAHLVAGLPAIVEYPLQGLNVIAPLRLDAVGVVASPEASLDEIAGLADSSGLPVEVFGFGRQQLLLSRDELGRHEGLVSFAEASDSHDPHVGEAAAGGEAAARELSTIDVAQELTLVDAKGFAFPVTVSRGETRLANARVTNLAPAAADLLAAGVRAFIVEQRALSSREARLLRARGLAGLAAEAARERSTTGHLFRGVS